MKRKLKLHTWEYFQKNHHVDNNGLVWKTIRSKSSTFLSKEVVDVSIYDTQHSFPGPYSIEIEDINYNPFNGKKDVRVISWMIDEIMTGETHPEYFI